MSSSFSPYANASYAMLAPGREGAPTGQGAEAPAAKGVEAPAEPVVRAPDADTYANILRERGPFRTYQIRERSPYELSNGHPVLCMPTGRRGAHANLVGGQVLETDPAVQSAGVDVGFSRDDSHLRAPDLAVGDFAEKAGWATEAPPLAVEYADTGQDEAELQKKIGELLAAGTKYVWVVRLTGPRRVEVHQRGKRVRVAKPEDHLEAPGILKNSVLVRALYDREAAHEATLRNLLQRRGYESLEALREEGIAEGKAKGIAEGIEEGKAKGIEEGKAKGLEEGKAKGLEEGKAKGIEEGKAKGIEEGKAKGKLQGHKEALFAVLAARGLAVSKADRKTIEGASDPTLVSQWITRAATMATTRDVLAGGPSAPARKPRSPRKPTSAR